MTMLRTMTMICSLSLAATLLPLPEALAAGRNGARPERAGHQTDFRGRGFDARRTFHAHREFQARQSGHERRFSGGSRFGRGQLSTPFGTSAYLDPAFYSFSFNSPSVAVREPSKPIDLNAFETMPVRMGIARAPTPQPTLYRLEGPRDRPVTRVIRIGGDEPRNARRSRYAHAETGALLLTVPGR